MCTAISFLTGHHYFGRTLDLEHHYSENVTVTPRNCPLRFRHKETLSSHHAIIGIAVIAEGQALYYDAMNEKGLCIAGLNFPGYACYFPEKSGADNITPFELIPWLLGQCSCVDEACALLDRINLTDEAFSAQWPLTPLHWMIADGERCVVVECTERGLAVHEDPVGVLTNNPPFDHQLINLSNYMQLSCEPAVNRFAPQLELTAYSRGMGAIGLPGDHSSQSRFVRAAFALHNSLCGGTEAECVTRFFHILGTVNVPRGCVRLGEDNVTTVYTSCCSAGSGIYYYTTYENRSIVGIDMHREDLDSSVLISYPLSCSADISIIN